MYYFFNKKICPRLKYKDSLKWLSFFGLFLEIMSYPICPLKTEILALASTFILYLELILRIKIYFPTPYAITDRIISIAIPELKYFSNKMVETRIIENAQLK